MKNQSQAENRGSKNKTPSQVRTNTKPVRTKAEGRAGENQAEVRTTTKDPRNAPDITMLLFDRTAEEVIFDEVIPWEKIPAVKALAKSLLTNPARQDELRARFLADLEPSAHSPAAPAKTPEEIAHEDAALARTYKRLISPLNAPCFQPSIILLTAENGEELRSTPDRRLLFGMLIERGENGADDKYGPACEISYGEAYAWLKQHGVENPSDLLMLALKGDSAGRRVAGQAAERDAVKAGLLRILDGEYWIDNAIDQFEALFHSSLALTRDFLFGAGAPSKEHFESLENGWLHLHDNITEELKRGSEYISEGRMAIAKLNP